MQSLPRRSQGLTEWSNDDENDVNDMLGLSQSPDLKATGHLH